MIRLALWVSCGWLLLVGPSVASIVWAAVAATPKNPPDPTTAVAVDLSGAWTLTNSKRTYAASLVEIEPGHYRLAPGNLVYSGVYELRKKQLIMIRPSSPVYADFVWQIRDADHLVLITGDYQGSTLVRQSPLSNSGPAAAGFQQAEATAAANKTTVQFKAMDGQLIDAKILKGKMVVLDFWAASDTSRASVRRLADLRKQYADDGVVFLGICCSREKTKAEEFIKEMGMDWPQYWDGEGFNNRIATKFAHRHLGTILLGPDGAVLWSGGSSTLGRELASALVAHPPQLVDPDVLAKAITALDTAEKAIKDGESVAAIKAMAGVMEEAKKDKAFARRLAEVEPKTQEAARQLLAEVDRLTERKQFLEAVAWLKELQQQFQGTFAAGMARQHLNELLANPDTKAQLLAAQREKEASDALAAARKLRDNEEHERAYPRFKAIVQDYAKTEAAKSAAEVTQAYEQDKALMERIKDAAVGAKVTPMLSIARSYVNARRYDLARQRFQEIITKFPGTSYARLARKELDEMPKD